MMMHLIPEPLRYLWPSLRRPEAPVLDLASLCPSVVDDEHEPVFLLATGWRTGSTLLQRILMSDRRLFLWGEPLGRLGILSRLTTAAAGIRNGYPDPDHIVDAFRGDVTTAWVANLYPTLETLRDALRALIVHWLATPARDRGFERWGLKEVRLGSREAAFLAWLFPKARFIVLSRHPFDVFCSVRQSGFWNQWPEWPVPEGYSAVAHWQQLVSSWTTSRVEHLFVRYEDLIEPGYGFSAIERWGSLELSPEIALATRVGDEPRRPRPTWWQRFVIRRLARGGMASLGYEAGPG
jgi:hypothetical protein